MVYGWPEKLNRRRSRSTWGSSTWDRSTCWWNRTDFIRTAIRNQLSTHGEVVKQSVARREMVLGLQRYTRRDLEKVLASGEQLQIQVLGLATIDDDVTPQLARQAIASIAVLGALRASPAVKAALADRTR